MRQNSSWSLLPDQKLTVCSKSLPSAVASLSRSGQLPRCCVVARRGGSESPPMRRLPSSKPIVRSSANFGARAAYESEGPSWQMEYTAGHADHPLPRAVTPPRRTSNRCRCPPCRCSSSSSSWDRVCHVSEKKAKKFSSSACTQAPLCGRTTGCWSSCCRTWLHRPCPLWTGRRPPFVGLVCHVRFMGLQKLAACLPCPSSRQVILRYWKPEIPALCWRRAVRHLYAVSPLACAATWQAVL